MSPVLASFRLDGSVAVVTGGASGIGRATAVALSEAGASVAVLDRDADGAAKVCGTIRSLHGRAASVAIDVTSEPGLISCIEQVIDELGPIDVLVNSAGIAIRSEATELPLESWNRVIDVNLTGVFLCARHVAKSMIRAGRAGSIVNLASIMGLSGGGLYPNISYQATKGAIVNLTRALAVEWAKHGIRVNAVAPTWVRTPFIDPLLRDPDLVRQMERLTPLGRLAEPEDVAAAVLFLASRASSMVTGHVLAVDGGFLAQ